jgi:hypothetical protein
MSSRIQAWGVGWAREKLRGQGARWGLTGFFFLGRMLASSSPLSRLRASSLRTSQSTLRLWGRGGKQALSSGARALHHQYLSQEEALDASWCPAHARMARADLIVNGSTHLSSAFLATESDALISASRMCSGAM